MPRVALTSRLVRTVVCPSDRGKIDLFDTQQRGFLLEVRPSGGKTFYQRYSDLQGRTRQCRIGPADLLTLSQARRKAKAVLRCMIIGDDPMTRRAEARSTPTLDQLVRGRYLAFVQSYKRSWKTDEMVLRRHILPCLGHRAIDQISGDAIIQAVVAMRGAGYASGTTNRVIVVLRRVFNLAKQWRVAGAEHNPTVGIKLAPDVKRERFLTVEEARRLIASIEKDQNEVAGKAIMLLLLTGARRNEITYARWQDINWHQQALVVPLAKSGKSRAVTLNAAALELLKSIVPTGDNPYVFPSPITGRPSASLYFPWHRIRTRAGLKDLRLHDLRHSFASFLVNKGCTLYTIQLLLGHSHSRYTERYAHLTTQSLLQAAESVTEVLSLGR